MSEIIWVKPRTVYPSYTHLWKLVELSGFRWVYIDQVEWESDNCYLLSPLNGEVPSPLPARKCQFIWVCIERASVYNEPLLGRPDFDELWLPDKEWQARVGGRYFLMGSHDGLGMYDPVKRFDIATNCYETPRRGAIFGQLRAEGYTFTPNSFDVPDPNLAASRIQLLPQQDGDLHCVTPLRFAIGAANHLPLVYEAEGCSCYPFEDQVDFIHAPYHGLVDAAKAALSNPTIQAIGDSLHYKLCVETDFRISVEMMFI